MQLYQLHNAHANTALRLCLTEQPTLFYNTYCLSSRATTACRVVIMGMKMMVNSMQNHKTIAASLS